MVSKFREEYDYLDDSKSHGNAWSETVSLRGSGTKYKNGRTGTGWENRENSFFNLNLNVINIIELI